LDDKAEGEDIIGKCKEALDFRGEYSCAFVAIGDNAIRKKYAKFLKERKFILPNIILPAAMVSPKAKLDQGILILPQSTVMESEIGDFCIFASNSLVNIDAKLGDYSHVDWGEMYLKMLECLMIL
jgi:UDP-3-O-[3-hydroxymyristoyl] glucosamine N-acyltransferase